MVNGATGIFYPKAMAYFLGPRYMDGEWMTAMSPRTCFSAYQGPLFVNSSREDFLRSQALLIVDDCGTSSRPVEFVFIDSKRKKAGHVHNVSNPRLKESVEVNRYSTTIQSSNEIHRLPMLYSAVIASSAVNAPGPAYIGKASGTIELPEST